jgi:hypothetical protein
MLPNRRATPSASKRRKALSDFRAASGFRENSGFGNAKSLHRFDEKFFTA